VARGTVEALTCASAGWPNWFREPWSDPVADRMAEAWELSPALRDWFGDSYPRLERYVHAWLSGRMGGSLKRPWGAGWDRDKAEPQSDPQARAFMCWLNDQRR
jgi:hypothetical protein